MQIVNNFYAKYHMKIISDILTLMIEGYHESGLEAQSKILYVLINVLTQNQVIYY